jgi:hypothetical protein
MGHWMENDWPAEDSRDILLKKVAGILKSLADSNMPDDDLRNELESIYEDIISFYEPDDPHSNGWVGDDGLP